MKLIDTTDARAHARMRTLVSSASAERGWQLAGKFRVHLVGMYFAEVGSEWGSDGKQQSDYLHHIEVVLSGRRQVVHGRVVHALEPGQVWYLPGNTPVERRCNEECEVLFFKLSCEWLPGVDPLLDWRGREPRKIGGFDPAEWHRWLQPDRTIGAACLLELRGRLLSWMAAAVPEIDEVITRHLETHTQFTEVFKFIERNLGADLRLGPLAGTYGATLEAFSMAFSRSTGMSPKDYLTRRLNQEALQWVINSDLKMKEIADKLRFSDEYYFSRFFKKFNGCAPATYRRRWLRG
ncbi:MAG: AraC family transcriptional regulator [Verrucomicrobia bacterium]|nr:AraC family transcriptional regulator [Verrucomicrobiota bacterium]